MNLLQVLESLLFVASHPLKTQELAKFANVSEQEVELALLELQNLKSETGVVLVHAGDKWQLATQPATVESVRRFLQSDLKEKLTDASLEVLSIIAYKQPISKAEIEAIRGVNSQYSLRLLLMRGLVDKTGDSRQSRYQVTPDFLEFLGVQSISDLPDYETISRQVQLPDTPETRNSTREEEVAVPIASEEV